MRPFTNAAVAARFEAYPPQARRRLQALRELIFRTAATTAGVGEIEETLKWGEPAYLTPNRSGSTVRIDWKHKDPCHCAMYFNCQTQLVDTFRTLFPHDFRFEGRRALLLPLEGKLPEDALAFCIAASLTYHLKKNRKS
ncbi:DUF1801 domain-containing protein [Hydrogenophaga sp.]|jgi:hypothetical protein|uniref:DUF1801 domain-containing protein n=1 Tax=Hydrogenophaga sp. TaxID=1904254 RepID=UPI003F7290D9